MPLWAYVTQALQEKLAAELHADKPWMRWAGGLRHLHKENVRIQKLIDEEFGHLEPEDLL